MLPLSTTHFVFIPALKTPFTTIISSLLLVWNVRTKKGFFVKKSDDYT